MPVPRLDPRACARRELAASLEGRNAAAVTLSASVPPPDLPDGHRLVTASGTLPSSDAQAVEWINRSLGLTGDKALAEDKVLLVYPEVANRNYVPKYQMFLGLSTLKNIAQAGAEGIALMNSHRTGGNSTPTELPYGFTFCSRLETMVAADGTRDYRVVMGAYMLAGKTPNGANGPSTDELHDAIVGGTLRSVSLGFKDRGDPFCDVCGRGLDELDEEGNFLCPHAPGTTRRMSAEEVKAQKARGVPNGVATVTLENAHVNELSAVYAGALVGAGFRKTARLARSAQLSPEELEGARLTFAPLLAAEPGALGPVSREQSPRFYSLVDEITSGWAGRQAPPEAGATLPVPKEGSAVKKITLAEAHDFWLLLGKPQIALADLAAQMGGELAMPNAANPPAAPLTFSPPPAPPATGTFIQNAGLSQAAPPAAIQTGQDTSGLSPDVARQLAAMRDEFQQERDRLLAERRRDRANAVALEADNWAESMIRAGKMTAAERRNQVALYARNAADDDASPVQIPYLDPSTGQPKMGGRLDVFKSAVALRPSDQAGSHVVANDPTLQAAATQAALAAAGQQGVFHGAPLMTQDESKALEDAMYAGAAAWAEKRNGTAARGLAGAR